MKPYLNLFALSIAIFLTGCASYAPPLQETAKFDPTVGYVYGKFKLDGASPYQLGHLRIGLVLVNRTNEYTIQFEPNNDLVVIAVPPGIYNLKGVAYAWGDYLKNTEKPFSSPILLQPFTVTAGTAYYVGDYRGKVGIDSNGLRLIQSWQLSGIQDNYASTTSKLKSSHSWLHNVTTHRAVQFCTNCQF